MQHFQSFNCAQILFVVHNVLKVENFYLSRRGQPNLLIKISRQTILNFVLISALLFEFFGEFVFLVNQYVNVLP